MEQIRGMAAPINGFEVPVAAAMAGDESLAAASARKVKSEFTRGLGIYPGDPREDFSPELVIDKCDLPELGFTETRLPFQQL